MDPNDAAIGKLMRSQDNDLRWVRAGLAEGILDLDVIALRMRSVINAEPDDFNRARVAIEGLCTEEAPTELGAADQPAAPKG